MEDNSAEIKKEEQTEKTKNVKRMWILLGVIAIIAVVAVIAIICVDWKKGTQKTNILSGNTWQASDDSVLVFDENGTYKWYRYVDDLTDNYYEGTYEVYVGEDAIKYIDEELEEYGVTEEEQRGVINNRKIDMNDYYAIVMNHQKCIIDGENIFDEPKKVPYYGEYHKENKQFELLNMNTANYHYYTLIEGGLKSLQK